MLGFIRPEYDYVSKDSLIEDILTDCKVAERSLGRDHWKLEREKAWEAWLRDFEWSNDLTDKKIGEVEDKVLAKSDEKL